MGGGDVHRQQARGGRHHLHRGPVDVSVHPAEFDRPQIQPDGVGLGIEPLHALQHARGHPDLPAHRSRLHRLGLPRAVGQGGRGRHPAGRRDALLNREGSCPMWYFAWVLGLPLACAFAVLNAMWLELRESDDERRSQQARK